MVTKNTEKGIGIYKGQEATRRENGIEEMTHVVVKDLDQPLGYRMMQQLKRA